jgi:hypothetical protein
MATYQANITKSIEPAMANPATLQQAGASTRAAIQSLGEGANAVYKGYVEQEVANIEQNLQTQAQEFYISRQAAQQAGEQAQQLEQMRPMAGSVFAEAMLGAQGEEGQQKATQQLKAFEDKLVRLKNASEGGMAPETFQANVQSELKKAVARYPGMADQIRSKFANITGVDLATQAYVSSYIKGVFTPAKPPKTKTPEDMAFQDIDEAAKTGMFGTREELLTDYRTNRGTYDVKMTGFKQVLQAQTQVNVIKNNVGALSGQSDLEADTVRAGFSAIFAGGLGATTLSQSVNDKEQVLGTTLKLMSEGKSITVDPVAFQTSIAVHNAQMKTNIEGSRTQAYRSIDAYLAKNPNVSDSKRKELYADIDRQANQSLSLYADDKGVGLLAIANIFKTYRDKSLTEKQQLVNLAIQQQSAMQNNPMVMAYWAGGTARENLKRTNKDFHEFMVGQEEELTTSVAGVRNLVNGATNLANVQRVLVQAGQAPGAVPTDPIASSSTTRAAHQALGASAAELLKKTSLLPAEVNIASAAFSTSVATGANSLTLARDYKKYGEQIAKLPDADQAVIKGNVSNSVSGAVISINDVKQVIEAKYKTTLTLGVNDAGEISVVPQVLPAQLRPRGISEMSAALNSPAMAERKKQSEAAQEFMKQVKPMLNNIVYGTSMLTQKDAKTVGTEFATVINNNQPYGGFYKSTAQPVAAPVSGTSALDAQVKTSLEKMKTSDPELNVDFVYSAYQRATPEAKKLLSEKFKSNTVTMADLNTK